MMVAWMISNCKNGVSSYEIARSTGVTQKTAWFMLHRIREAMKYEDDCQAGRREAEVEVDEAFIGGEGEEHALQRKREDRKKFDPSVAKTRTL